MDRARWGHSVLVRLALVAAIVAAVHGGGTTVAGLPDRYGVLASNLPGIEQAVGRFYHDEQGSVLAAFVFRFRDVTSAGHALDTLDPGYDRPPKNERPIRIDRLGPQTRAHHGEVEGYSSSQILTQEDVFIYVVTLDASRAELDTVSLATEVITSMVTTDVSERLGAYQQDGTSTGGPWDTLPAGDGQSPPGFWAASDVQYYPDPSGVSDGASDTSEGSGQGGSDLTQMEGFQRAVSRTYGGDPALLDVPNPVPDGFYLLAANVIEYDTADHAQAAAIASYEAGVQVIIGDSDANPKPVNLGALGDYGQAAVFFDELDGVTMEGSLVIVQEGPYLYATFTVARGPEADTVARSTAVLEVMLTADAGTGEEVFDAAGGSTGGLWDKLPKSGDPVLQGLEPTMDQEMSPGVPSEVDEHGSPPVTSTEARALTRWPHSQRLYTIETFTPPKVAEPITMLGTAR